MKFICYIFLLIIILTTRHTFAEPINHDEEAPKTYYQILGVEQSASFGNIRSAFKKGALKHHPDRNKGQEQEANKRMQLISEAYKVLSDSERRNEYDSQQQSNALMQVFSRCCAGSMSLFNIFSCRK